MTVDDFAKAFFQDVLAESDAAGQFVEDVFFQKICEHLMETGELESADRVLYKGPLGRASESMATVAILPMTIQTHLVY